MQSKDIIAQPLGTEFVIAHPNAYVHKSERKIETIREGKSLTVKLHSKNTYAESNHTWKDATHTTFIPTNTEKVKYFLVYYTNGTEDVYRTIKAQDFIGLRSEVEVAWANTRVAEAEALERKNKEEAVIESLREQAQATQQATEVAVLENAIAMFGKVVGEEVGRPWIRSGVNVERLPDGALKGKIETSGEIRIPVEHFLRLAERWANLQDA